MIVNSGVVRQQLLICAFEAQQWHIERRDLFPLTVKESLQSVSLFVSFEPLVWLLRLLL